MSGSSSSRKPMQEVLPVGSAKGKSPVDPAAPAEVKNKEKELVLPIDPAAPAKKKKMKKVRMPQYHMNRIMTVEKWEPLPPIDEEFLKNLAALIPNGEQFLVDRGLTVENYRELDNMDFAEKAQKDMIAEIQEDYAKNGYVEMVVTDDEEEITAPAGKGRRRFRPG